MGQTKTAEKSNEITAIPELLSMPALQGAIVTIDAMGCQKKIVTGRMTKNAQYVIAVKEHQKNLYEEMDTIFQAAVSETFPLSLPICNTVDKDHGRLAFSLTRPYSVSSLGAWFPQRRRHGETD